MQYYIVDAFTNTVFKGNPAGVCILDRPITKDLMQKIATENNLPETAFVLPQNETYNLKWFTPKAEIDLCGHATLASAFVISNFINQGQERITFTTCSGDLTVTKNGEMFDMIFPNNPATEITLSNEQKNLVHCKPIATFSERDLYILLKSEEDVINYVPNYASLQKLNEWLGVVITAEGTSADFVSRYFCPELQEEDPVTGSSHCSLIPFWAARLKKRKMVAKQLSKRGGILQCELLNDSEVKISGCAALYLQGQLMD